MMDLSNYNKAEVLCTLFNRAVKTKQAWIGYQEMTKDEAAWELDANPECRFHELYGRPLHVDLSDMSKVEVHLYNFHNGPGLAERILKRLKPMETHQEE